MIVRISFLMALGCALLGVPSSALAQTSGTRATTVTGVFHINWGDDRADGSAKTIYVLTTAEGTSVRLRIDESVARAAGGLLALNRKRVAVTGVESAIETTTGMQVLSIQRVEEDVELEEGPEVSGAQPWVSILCKFQDIAAEPKALSYFQNMYASTYPGFDHYWREQSFDIVNVTGSGAAGWFVMPQPRSYYFYDWNGDGELDANLGLLLDDCIAAADPTVNFAPYVGINLMFNDVLDCCAWGGGSYLTLDGVSRSFRVTWNPPWAFNGISVVAHEMGHGFGLPHSSGDYGQVYDNQWDVMSGAGANCYRLTDPTYGCLGQHTISYHKDLLEWISFGQKFVAPGGQSTITLERLALPQTPNYRMVQIPVFESSSHFYTVEVRQQAGYDYKLPGQGVIIHEVDTDREEPAHVVDIDGNGDTGDAGAIWTVGETFTDSANGVSVHIDSASTTTFTVTVNVLIGTTTSLASSVNPSLVNTSVTFTATVTAGATGTVTFRDGDTTLGTVSLAGGTATFSTSSLTAGAHAITATYNGSATHAPSISDPLVQNVVSSLLTINDVAVAEGDSGQTNAVFTVSLAPSSTDTVVVAYGTSDGTASSAVQTAITTDAISIPLGGNATPYPSTVSISGATGTISKVTVTLNSVTHTFPRDIDILLVGPTGAAVVLMSDAGGGNSFSAQTFTFDDAAAAFMTSGPLTSGTYRPTNIEDYEGLDAYSAPAPGSGYSSTLSAFNTTSPNGTWSLYVVDDFSPDSGAISGGWSLRIEVNGGGDYIGAAGVLTFPPGSVSQTVSVPVVGDNVAEANETFFVTLSDALYAVISDAQGVGTIANEDGTLAAPSNVVATATGSTSVNVTWTPAANAGYHRVYRSSNGTSYSAVGTVAGVSSFSDPTAAANTAYLYTVRAVGDTESANSNRDLATTVVFTDSPLVPTVTRAKLLHFTQLLTAVNAVRTLATLSPIAFTLPAPASAVSVRRQHLLDLRSGLDQARAGLSLSPLTYTDGTIVVENTLIKDEHVNDLRNGVK